MVADFDRECNVKTRRGKADIVEVDLGELDRHEYGPMINQLSI
jgi:hypothetical protein